MSLGRVREGRWERRAVPWLVVLVWAAVGCGGDVPSASVPGGRGQDASAGAASETAAPEQNGPVELQPENSSARSPARWKPEENPQVLIETSLGAIRIELDLHRAPQTVQNFLANYVDRKAYDGTIVHHVDPTYMIALGGFDADLQPIASRSPVLNEADNGLKNVAGTVAMAHLPEYVHSATSQFFINVVDNSNLDYRESEDRGVNGYCVFGRVVDGMDIVRKIARAATGEREGFPKVPDPPIIVRSIRRVASSPAAPRSALSPPGPDRR